MANVQVIFTIKIIIIFNIINYYDKKLKKKRNVGGYDNMT